MARLNLSRGWELSENGEGATVKTEAHSGWSKGWVAGISLAQPGAQYDLERKFLRPDSESLSRAGNGSKTYEALPDGVYEADSVYRSLKSFRTYFVVRGGQIEVLTDKAAAKAALAASTESTRTADAVSAYLAVAGKGA